MVESKALYPRPFLKWAGGKAELVPELLRLVPSRWWEDLRRRKLRYHEPFLGAGALYLALVRRVGRGLPAFLADSNRELVETWCTVLDDPEAVRTWLIAQGTSGSDYYRIRAMREDRLTPVEAAGRMIYLNKTCFNGLYRTGPDFLDPTRRVFNVPWGKAECPALYDPGNFAELWELELAPTINCCDFREVGDRVFRGDLVYFDPPYVPVKRTSKTDYGSGNFDYSDHEDLALLFEELVERGARCLLSNADTPWVRDRYRAFEVHLVEARRSISRDGKGRSGAREVVVVGGR